MQTLEEEAQWDFVINGESIGAMVVCFVVAALSNASGVGGGFLWVPLFCTFFDFSLAAAGALSQSCVALGALGSVFWALVQQHPENKNAPLISYQVVIILAPVLMEGQSIGVLFNPVMPPLIIACLLFLFLCLLAFRTGQTALRMRKHEKFKKSKSIVIKMDEENTGSNDIDSADEQADTSQSGHLQQYPFKKLLIILALWVSFLAFQIGKRYVGDSCSWQFWVMFTCQLLLFLALEVLFVWRLQKGDDPQTTTSKTWKCQGEIALQQWSVLHISGFLLLVFAIGLFVGLLGLGAGLILTPLLLELRMHPISCGSTTMLVVLMSSGTAAITYLVEDYLNVEYAAIYGSICLAAAMFGLLVVSKLVSTFKMASIVVFLLAGIMLAGAIMTIAFSGRRAVESIIDTGEFGTKGFCTANV